MEPQELVDVSSQLRGIGHPLSRSHFTRKWNPSQHVRPMEYAARWEEAVNKPRATRNPALGADYILDTPFADGFSDAILDVRDPAQIIGMPTRFGARIVCRGQKPQK